MRFRIYSPHNHKEYIKNFKSLYDAQLWAEEFLIGNWLIEQMK